ncbi:hypothetical protein G6712_06085 [Polynucleobacter paneuropaeus]|nr:hypothetical protein [Polynucleobacter paneuropaeus]
MKNIFKILVTIIIALSPILVNAQNFRYTNQVWATPDCNVKANIRAWVADSGGALTLLSLTEQGLMKNKVKDFKISGNRVLFSYEKADASEVYEFYGNTARVMERIVNGKLVIKDGLVLSRNQFSPEILPCSNNTIAAQTLMNPPVPVTPKSWHWPNTKGDKFSYCAGVFDYASKSSDNPTGKKIAYDLYLKAAAMAKQAKVGVDRFADLAQQGSEDASAIYQEAFDKDMGNGKLDPTMTARSQIRYAVQECQNSLY